MYRVSLVRKAIATLLCKNFMAALVYEAKPTIVNGQAQLSRHVIEHTSDATPFDNSPHEIPAVASDKISHDLAIEPCYHQREVRPQ